MPYRWPADTVFTHVALEVEDRTCSVCGQTMTVCDHRHRRLFTFDGPLWITSKLVHCPDTTCAGRHQTYSPESETALAMPWWVLGWDVFCWVGHRRFARHWSVSQLRSELADAYGIALSADALEKYVRRYQCMVAARHQDAAQLAAVYAKTRAVILAIDGLQPEKGHETLYVVRELTQKRVWFAEPLLSSAASEVRGLLAQARQWAERLGLSVALWMSDKQDAFVSGIAAEFPGVPHRYCSNHFLRDLAKPMLEEDSHAKVQMRRKVRGLRVIEREILAEQRSTAAAETQALASTVPDNTLAANLDLLPGATPIQTVPPAAPSTAGDVVLDYCTTIRGILNDDQGGPLQPPGLRMTAALTEVQASLQRNVAAKKGGTRRTASSVCPRVSPRA
jgi:hypothetical protein